MAKDDDKPRRLFSKRFKWSPSWSKSSSRLVATPAWLPLPKIVMAAFGLNLLFILIGVVVSGLVLGGTITINAKAIGLTQSLVLISSMFGLAYICFHVFAARRPESDISRFIQQRSPRHTKIVVLGRITIALWSVSLLAVAITLGSQPASNASSLGPLQADIAACIINCLDMTIVALVVERAKQPFVLPWVTPPIPEGQSSAAKALIDDILGDGISGHPYAGSTACEDAATAPSRASSSDDEPIPVTPKRKTRVTIKETTDDPNVSASTLAIPPSLPSVAEPFPFPSSGSTLVERQELWSRVDEGAAKPSPIKLPPPPPQHNFAPAAASYIPPVPSPLPQFFPPQPSYVSPMQNTKTMSRPPLSRASASGFPRYSAATLSVASASAGIGGPRPLYEAGRMHSYTAYVSSRQAYSTAGDRADGVRSVPPMMGARDAPDRGKKLFDKAVEGLKATGQRDEPIWDDYSAIKVPGSFVEM